MLHIHIYSCGKYNLNSNKLLRGKLKKIWFSINNSCKNKQQK